MTNTLRFIAFSSILLSAIVIGGCDVRPDQMTTQNVPHVSNPMEPVTVLVEGGGTPVTNEIYFARISNEQFSEALTKSIVNANMFSKVMPDPNGAKWCLVATLQTLTQPMSGSGRWAHFSVSLRVEWRLINISNGAIAWHDSILSFKEGDDVFDCKEVTEETAKTNIEQALNELAKQSSLGLNTESPAITPATVGGNVGTANQAP